MKEIRRVALEGEELSFLFEAKRVKNYNMRVHADGTVSVSAPMGARRTDVDRFVLAHTAFIRRARAKMAARAEEKKPPKDGDTVFYRGKAYTLRIREGKTSLLLTEGEMLLSLPDPARAEQALTRETERLFYPVLLAACKEREPFFVSRGAKAPTEIRLKYMKSMWGNCRAKRGVLTFSSLLASVSPALLDYVVCHEYAHLLHPDHGKGFYALLARACPDHAQKRRALKNKEYNF